MSLIQPGMPRFGVPVEPDRLVVPIKGTVFRRPQARLTRLIGHRLLSTLMYGLAESIDGIRVEQHLNLCRYVI